MSERKEVDVDLVSFYGDDDGFPRSIPEWIAWLQDFLAKTPPECVEKTYVALTLGYTYDETSGRLDIGYWRPETDEEFRNRTEEEEARENARNKEREQQDLCQYKRLKAKFEGHS